MSILRLSPATDGVLRARALPIERVTEDVCKLAASMIETMYAHNGIGIAAPQVGHSVQMFVANPSQKRGRELVLLNPVLEHVSGRAVITEGCLSLPNIWEQVKRAARVRITGLDLSGTQQRLEAEGMLAIVLQHEFDHLQGRLFIDRLPWLRRRYLAAKTRVRKLACV